jgi:hypothetical protein
MTNLPSSKHINSLLGGSYQPAQTLPQSMLTKPCSHQVKPLPKVKPAYLLHSQFDCPSQGADVQVLQPHACVSKPQSIPRGTITHCCAANMRTVAPPTRPTATVPTCGNAARTTCLRTMTCCVQRMKCACGCNNNQSNTSARRRR